MTEIIPEFKATSWGISRSAADASHRHTSFSPEIRAESEVNGFVAEVQNLYENLKHYAKTDAQKQLLNEEMARFQSGYASKKNEHLVSMGRTFSVMITGGSGFNNRAHEKTNQAEQNKYESMQEFKERAIAAIKRDLKKLSIEEQGGEIPALENKIARLEKAHEAMVISNKVLRKSATQEEKIKEIMDKTGLKEETVLTMFKPDCYGDIGFAGWQLQNSNANIKSAKKHLAELQAKETTPTSDITFAGGKIVDNADADRVQIIHDSKPAQEIITKLKAEGWRWSPAGKCWQRKRTANALWSAKRITGIDGTHTATAQEVA